MIFEFFRAADGDSFLLTSDGHNLLVDGGRKGSFTDNVLPSLDAIRVQGQVIDAICVSHIDADHITGILALFDLMLEWRVYDYHHDTIHDTNYEDPSPWRPPEIGKVWHNGFEQQTNAAPDAPTQLLQSTALTLAASNRDWIQRAAEACGELAASITQGIQLAQRLGNQQLHIPLNPEFGGNLVTTAHGHRSLQIGDATLKLLGPTEAQISDLREEWTNWVADNSDTIDKLNRESQRDADRLGLATTDAFFALRSERAEALANRANVTVPNLASIMFFVTEGSRSAILTGDGLSTDVTNALQADGDLGPDGLHVDVLKVPHHGSEHNSDRAFYRRITADHYVIPSNGSHRNPDLRVIADIIKSRVGRRSPQTLTQQVGDPFTIWITANPDTDTSNAAKHLRKVRSLIKQWQRRYPDHVKFEFLTDRSFTLNLT